MSRHDARSILQRLARSAKNAAASPGCRHAAAVAAVLLVAAPALATTSGGEPMPWEGPMDRFLSFFTGPFVRAAAIIGIVLLGVGMAFSENGTGTRKMVTPFFGIALAFGAATWGLTFFGFSGGASIEGQVLEPAAPALVRPDADDDSHDRSFVAIAGEEPRP